MESRNNRSDVGNFQLVEAEKIKKRRLQIACEHFNRDPKKGFQYLQHVGIFSSPLKAQEVAMFFRHTPGLDKVVVGNFVEVVQLVVVEVEVERDDYFLP
jgi:brefeldin A-resistance guanine nucleotide exchange factor 1